MRSRTFVWGLLALAGCTMAGLSACGDETDAAPVSSSDPSSEMRSGTVPGASESAETSIPAPEDVAEFVKGAQEREAEPSTAHLETLGAGIADFGFDLLRALHAADDSGNVLFSPVSLLYPLTMVWEGSRGATRSGLHNALHMRLADEELHEAMNALERALVVEDDDFALALVNAIWLDQQFNVNENWLDVLARHYGAGSWFADFRNPERYPIIAEAINGWVSEHTRGLIDRLVSADSFSPQTRALLLNALYLKDDWLLPFDSSRTRDTARFHLESGAAVEVPMMFQQDRFRYHEEVGLQALTMRLKSLPVVVMAILPPEGEEAAFLAGLDAEEIGRLREAQTLREGNVRVPRLDMEQAPDVYEALAEAMGMRELFRNGDYLGVGTPDEFAALAISRIGHRAVLIMDEEGVEAAAATHVGISETDSSAVIDRFDFVANRPFLLLLLHATTDAPLMVAWVADPTQ